MKSEQTETKKRCVLVTDNLRGVVWGELVEQDRNTRTCVLRNARHRFFWVCKHNAKGIFGLAVEGPQPGSKVGPKVERHELFYEKITDCTETANLAWEAAKWV